MGTRKNKYRIAVVTATLMAMIAGGIVTWKQVKVDETKENGEVAGISAYSESMEDDLSMKSADMTDPDTQPDSTETSGNADGTMTVPESKETENAENSETQGEVESENENTDGEEAVESESTSDEETFVATAGETSSLIMDFNEATVLELPVSGSVLIPYNMENTVYFPTLDLYKCNPGVVLSAEVGTEVKAVANSCVVSIRQDAETGTTVTMNMGNGYQAVYGQLNGVELTEGQQVEAGTVIGTIAEPTKYYSKEGSNLYFELSKEGQTLDPTMYLPPVVE